MDLLGDPISLVNHMGTGVYSFFRKTRNEMLGHSAARGEGVRDLVQGVVGGTFGSVAKIAGSLEGIVSGVGDVEDQAQGAASDARHLGDGLVHGGRVFLSGLQNGLTSIVEKPLEGARDGNVIWGIGKGLVGAVAAPIAGALGAVSAVSASVDASTRFYGERPVGRRRRPRAAGPARVLDVVQEAEVAFAPEVRGGARAGAGGAVPH